jgi:hypothetical protein
MAHGDAREGKWRGNWRLEWVASTIHTTSEHGVAIITTIITADAHTSAAYSRLNWSPRRFNWTRPFRRKTKSGFCACAITFLNAVYINRRRDDIGLLNGFRAFPYTSILALTETGKPFRTKYASTSKNYLVHTIWHVPVWDGFETLFILMKQYRLMFLKNRMLNNLFGSFMEEARRQYKNLIMKNFVI